MFTTRQKWYGGHQEYLVLPSHSNCSMVFMISFELLEEPFPNYTNVAGLHTCLPGQHARHAPGTGEAHGDQGPFPG